MEIAELKDWLKGSIEEEKRILERIVESDRGHPIQDIVARRVVETEILIYKIVLRKIEKGGD